MNDMSSSYHWMRQRRKRRAACRSSSTRVFGAKVHRGRSAATDELVAVARKSRLCSSPLLCWVVFTGPFNRSYCCCLYQSSISLLT
jgi:hypothetical protein